MIKVGDKVYTFMEDGIGSVVFSYEVTEANLEYFRKKLNTHFWKNYTEARAELIKHLREQVYELQQTCQTLMNTKKRKVKHLSFTQE
jgi:hypothetical protein